MLLTLLICMCGSVCAFTNSAGHLRPLRGGLIRRGWYIGVLGALSRRSVINQLAAWRRRRRLVTRVTHRALTAGEKIGRRAGAFVRSERARTASKWRPGRRDTCMPCSIISSLSWHEMAFGTAQKPLAGAVGHRRRESVVSISADDMSSWHGGIM